jgi:hypothetical protein
LNGSLTYQQLPAAAVTRAEAEVRSIQYYGNPVVRLNFGSLIPSWQNRSPGVDYSLRSENDEDGTLRLRAQLRP